MAANKSAIIEIRDITKNYQMGATTVRALAGVSLRIERGDFVAIMGPSGSGKSTLMHLLGLLDVPDSGSYFLDGDEVAGLSEDRLASLRGQTLGFIFQQFNLLSRTSAEANVALPLLYSGEEQDLERARSLLKQVGLGDRCHHHPNELSGGQQQRVAIARALIHQPELLFADEPTGNLDSHSEREILEILQKLNAAGITIVMVTHEEEVAKSAKRIIRMRDGKIQSDQRLSPVPELDVLKRPRAKKETIALKPMTAFLRESRVHFLQGVTALLANKVRTFLSVLGILIGVSAVIAMLAIGKGAKESIEKELSSLGSNLLVVMPGATRSMGVAMEFGTVTRFTIEDADLIQRRVPGVVKTSPSVNGKVRVNYGSKNWATSVTGTTADYEKLHSTSAEVGRFFTDDENSQRARVALIGTTVLRELFGEINPIGENIRINKVSFQIIGVLKSRGAQGFRDQDDIILVPLATAMRRLLGKDYVDQIDVQVAGAEQMESVDAGIRELIIDKHRLPPSQEDSFQIRNMEEIQRALSSTSTVLSGLLACIAAISLLVGGIGIMNIMLVSVTERTREIGLRKTLGAKRRDILMQFLIEAVIVSAAGGILGILLGWVITLIVTSVFGWAATVSIFAIALAILFSGGIGVLFGLWPAKKAASLGAIVALRYE